MIAELEPCPPELAHLERPQYGGSLFFHQETGIAGCPKCGWRGVPTVVEALIQTWCPACLSPNVDREVLMDWADDMLWGYARPVVRTADPRQVERNRPCPCGSGVKAKRCGCEEYTV